MLDDTVLEEHSVDPSLVQIKILGSGGKSSFLLSSGAMSCSVC